LDDRVGTSFWGIGRGQNRCMWGVPRSHSTKCKQAKQLLYVPNTGYIRYQVSKCSSYPHIQTMTFTSLSNNATAL